MTESDPTEVLTRAVRKAFVHFSKAGYEVASGVSDIVFGVIETLKPSGDGTDSGTDVERIDIE